MDVGTITLLIAAVTIIIVFALVSDSRRRKRNEQERRDRREALLMRYGGNNALVDDIEKGLIRQGMTYQMVIDAWGEPAALDRKVYRTKVKEILKYGPGPRSSFANRVTVEDGIVVGWEQR